VRWLEVSLTVESELAEPIADLLSRLTPGGAAIEAATVIDDGKEGQPSGPYVVRGYLPVDDSLPEKRRRLEEGLWHLSRIRPLPDPVYRDIEEQDWAEAWKEHYRPIPIGRRLLIQPAWLSPPAGQRIPLVLDPGMAFGTGAHPSTQLVLAILEDVLRPGQTVLDLGCGSGILSVAAARLGAASTLALDIDPQAVHIARENIRRNGVAATVDVERGSLEALQHRTPPFQADVILANILAPTLEQLITDGLGEVLAPAGRLVLSGILEHQTESLATHAARFGLDRVEVRAIADWRALVLTRRPPPKVGAA
jgi:ribosomal protein L11 methyltransferase